MTDTSENQPVEGAEILKLLRALDAQARANGEALTRLETRLATLDTAVEIKTNEIRQDLAEIRRQLTAVTEVVQRAEPLLNSGPARALAGGGVLQMIRGTRRNGDG